MSKLLLDSHPLVVIPELAESVGLSEAIVLQQVHYWVVLNAKDGRNYRDGFYWTYNSYEGWREQFPFWSKDGVKKVIMRLERQGLLITGNYNRMKMDKTKWYRINYDLLEGLVGLKFGGRIVSGIGRVQSTPPKGYKVPHGEEQGVSGDISPEEVSELKEMRCAFNLTRRSKYDA